MDPIQITPIGVVRTDTTEIDSQWRKTVSQIHLDTAYQSGLQGLEDWSHIVVIFSMHETTFDPDQHLVSRPGDREDMPEVGVFAQRSNITPNTIGMTAVKVLEINDNVLTVRGLDAIDGTPVIDIKPYAPIYDGANDPLVPVWFLRLMQG
jgi:tRNA-Thr(GGU) m(6)t(6)A37 methyltransferase TsaA